MEHLRYGESGKPNQLRDFLLIVGSKINSDFFLRVGCGEGNKGYLPYLRPGSYSAPHNQFPHLISEGSTPLRHLGEFSLLFIIPPLFSPLILLQILSQHHPIMVPPPCSPPPPLLPGLFPSLLHFHLLTLIIPLLCSCILFSCILNVFFMNISHFELEINYRATYSGQPKSALFITRE